MLVSVLMGVLPFVLAYQVIAPLVMGESIGASFIISRVALVLACLVLQALFYGWGLTKEEQEYAVAVLMAWIEKQMNKG